MKIPLIFSVLSTAWLLTACSTSQGGNYTQSNSTISAESYPIPAASPTQRPGMNPEDPRDPLHASRGDAFEPAKP